MIDIFPHLFYYGTQKVFLVGAARDFWGFCPSQKSLLYISSIGTTFLLDASSVGVLTIYGYNDFKLTVHSNRFCLQDLQQHITCLLITSLHAETRILYSIQNSNEAKLGTILQHHFAFLLLQLPFSLPLHTRTWQKAHSYVSAAFIGQMNSAGNRA